MILEKQKENLELNDGEIHESFATVNSILMRWDLLLERPLVMH